MDNIHINHFGVKDKNNNLHINIDACVIIDKKVHNKVPQFIIDSYREELEKRKGIYEDEECTIYSDEWCIKH